VMEPVLIYNLHQSLTIVQRVLDTFNDYWLKGIEANIDVCKAYVENSIGVITALNPHVGYITATKVAKEARETGVPSRDIILKEGILSESAVDRILDSCEMTNPGISGSEMLIK